MNRFETTFGWRWLTIVIFSLTLGLSACDGKDGAPGLDGATGQQGPEGPEGPPGPGASITPLESCGVCHDDGSFASAPDYHALDPIEFVSNIVIAPNGDDLTVSFELARDGVPTAGYDTIQRGYRTEGTVRTSIVDTLSDLTDIGGGSYSFTIPDGNLVAGDNRYLFRVAAGDDRETRVYFYKDFPASPFEGPVAVTAEACTNCHGPEGIDVHGGYFQAENGGEPCLVCHGRDNGEGRIYAGLGTATHAYHSNVWDVDEHITYPTYMTNCNVCHADQDQLDAVNAMTVSGEGCLSCHGSMDSWDFQAGLEFHLNIADPSTSPCLQCHIEGGARQLVTEFHNGATTGRGGIIWDGVDTSVIEGAKFDWQITEVDDDGVNLAISWTATYEGAPVDPCNDTLGPGAPTFHAATDADGDFTGNLSMLRNYAQGDDFILGMSTSAPGQALSVNVTVDNTACAAGIATTTIPVDDVTAERGIVALQGKPRTVSPDPAGPAEGQRVRAKTPTYEWMVGDGAAPVAMRRDIVDNDQCLKCHVGSLYQHGGNRVDNAGMCILCHNSASNEKNVRVSTMGIDPADTYDGREGETYELKTMLHRIHSAGLEGQQPYVIYRGRGVYAFAPEGTVLPNWPGTGSQPVFGSTIGNVVDGVQQPPPYVINHNFHSPTYPRSVNECASCHVEDSVRFQPDQTQAMATTVDAGGTQWNDQIDDVLQGAATTACVTCHTSGPAKGHAYQNGWDPQAFEEGRKTIIDAVK